MIDITISDYLTEEKLGIVLSEMFPLYDILPQFRVKIDKGTLRIDYAFYINSKLVLVEFDGFYHYTQSSVQDRDNRLKEYCAKNDIILITVPYFIQLNNSTKYMVFSDVIFSEFIPEVNFITDFAHGFIDSKCILPNDFNIGGVSRMMSELNGRYNEIKHEVQSSIINNIKFNVVDYDYSEFIDFIVY